MRQAANCCFAEEELRMCSKGSDQAELRLRCSDEQQPIWLCGNQKCTQQELCIANSPPKCNVSTVQVQRLLKAP